ncbi:MAG TPA: tail fiber protein [Blastocatellia bacterium]|nr:tail fiber protein [Blastocatellia bacterium]
MSSPYVGEIRMFGGSFAPVGWALCQGQTIPISQNDTLFNLIGTTYGGDGQETFDLPNLAGRVPVHQGQGPGISQNYVIGETGGVEGVTLTTQQIPNHSHLPACNNTSAGATTNGGVWGTAPTTANTFYGPTPANVAFNAQAIQPQGGSQPHENMQPFLVVTFIISLFGIFPTQN